MIKGTDVIWQGYRYPFRTSTNAEAFLEQLETGRWTEEDLKKAKFERYKV